MFSLQEAKTTSRNYLKEKCIETSLSVIEEKDARPTFGDAYAAVLENSYLFTMGESGDWANAFRLDVENAYRLIDNLCKDLSKITGRSVVRKSKMVFKCLEKGCSSFEERTDLLRKEFKQQFISLVDICLANLDCRKRDWRGRQSSMTFPLQRIFIPKNTDVISFHFLDEFHRKPVDYTFAGFALKSPDDFTRKVPARVKEKLEILKTTHYNYTPKILDGLLTEEEVVNFYDPALVLQLWFDHCIVCDVWNEPSKYNKITDFRYKNGGVMAGIVLFISFLLLCLMGFIFPILWQVDKNIFPIAACGFIFFTIFIVNIFLNNNGWVPMSRLDI